MNRKIIKLDTKDNVAVAVADLNKSELIFNGDQAIEVLQPVPVMHKIAVCPIEQGELIIKYGQTIGCASETIQIGQHVNERNCVLPQSGLQRSMQPAHVLPDALPVSESTVFFDGFKRPSGKVGTRNFIGVITSVNCSATVARAIAAAFSAPDALSAYDNIDGVIALTHETGCGMRGAGEGFDALQRTLEGYIRHPNFGGLLMVGLGCETLQLSEFLENTGLSQSQSFAVFNIQDVGGTRAAVEKGVEKMKGMLASVNDCVREPCPVSELTLAVQCGGSDAFSGITANPALGVAADILVEQGGSVIYSETPEIYGAEHLLMARAINQSIADKLADRIAWWENYTRINGFELNNNPSPGNKVGGLSTILEKSLGAQAKGGSTPLTDVLLYAEPLKTRGLVFMDSPGYDPVSVTGQVASGANLICFTTGRGSAFGFKPVPSLKLSTNTLVYNSMGDDMDINCGTIVDGEQTMEQVGQLIFDAIVETASGKRTKSELLGYGDFEFCPWKIGAVV